MSHRQTILTLLVSFVTAVTITATAFCEMLYVTAKGAQLRSGKTSLDPVVANLKIGETVEVVKRKDRWLQVKTAAGVTGWIYDGKVSSSKPASGDGELASLGRSMRGTDASAVTASAGARGLDKASDSYANRSGITQQHRDEVDGITTYKLADDDVQEFLKSGKLGEYAE